MALADEKVIRNATMLTFDRLMIILDGEETVGFIFCKDEKAARFNLTIDEARNINNALSGMLQLLLSDIEGEVQ